MDIGRVYPVYWTGAAANCAGACQLAVLLLSVSAPLRERPEASFQRLGPAAYGISHERRGRVGVAGRVLSCLAPATRSEQTTAW